MKRCPVCFGQGRMNHIECESCKGTGEKPIEPFDITKHEWYDSEPCEIEEDGSLSLYPTEDDILRLFREDAIALAKHFKLTPEDLLS